MEYIFLQLAIVMGIAVMVSLIVKSFRQPLIVGYIISGIIVGPSLLNIVKYGDNLQLFAHIGVAFLLFIVGLGLNPQVIKEVGKISLITGISQIFFTSVIGLIIGMLLGLPFLTALYIAVAFTFSSTIIVLRLLYDKEAQDTLYGKISIGFLLVQDIVALIIFIFLSSTSEFGQYNLFVALLFVFGKIVGLGGVLYLIWKYVIPSVDLILAESKQVLFIFSIAMCFVLASLFQKLGFSIELGALIAGVLLSTSPYHREIASRIQPLRDFFLVIFFIMLGTQISVSDVISYWSVIVVFTLFIIIGNPLIVLLIMSKLGYSRKTAFNSGLTVAQISEFSLIMLGIGVGLNQIPEYVVGIGTIVGLLTIGISSYLITYNNQVYKQLKPIIKFLTPFAKERETTNEIMRNSFQVLLFGSHRTGGGIMEILKKKKISYLVIDHDPKLIAKLKDKDIPCEFGSADDIVLLDELNYSKTSLVISTIPSNHINVFLLDYFKKKNKKISFICVENHKPHADKLYKQGAEYVIMPPYLGRVFMAELFKNHLFNRKKYAKERIRHIRDLKNYSE